MEIANYTHNHTMTIEHRSDCGPLLREPDRVGRLCRPRCGWRSRPRRRRRGHRTDLGGRRGRHAPGVRRGHLRERHVHTATGGRTGDQRVRTVKSIIKERGCNNRCLLWYSAVQPAKLPYRGQEFSGDALVSGKPIRP